MNTVYKFKLYFYIYFFCNLALSNKFVNTEMKRRSNDKQIYV